MSEETKQLILSEAQKQEMRANIARGVEYLDENIPGWRNQIDWGRFEFIDPENCIWGQLRRVEEKFRNDFRNIMETSEFGWYVPTHIYRETVFDEVEDDRSEDGSPYTFMDHEWSRQNPARTI